MIGVAGVAGLPSWPWQPAQTCARSAMSLSAAKAGSVTIAAAAKTTAARRALDMTSPRIDARSRRCRTIGAMDKREQAIAARTSSRHHDIYAFSPGTLFFIDR